MIYRNPVICWLDEMNPGSVRQVPPPAPFTVTRSEIGIRPAAAPFVHIWYALVPAEPASPFPPGLMPGEEVIRREDLRGS